MRALEARLAEARRKLSEFEMDQSAAQAGAAGASDETHLQTEVPDDDDRSQQIEAELEALKRQLGQGG